VGGVVQMFKKRFSIVEREVIVEKASKCLWTDSGRSGLKYLKEKRKLDDDVIKEFKIGYMPRFLDHQLNNRIILPIYDSSNNLIAISSRMIDNSNSPLPVYWHESYEKSFYLYGINNSKLAMSKLDYTIVTEGQFDVLQLFNHGIRNVVGLCANKMSKVQTSVVYRYSKFIVLMLDNDRNQAGQNGAKKIINNKYQFGTKGYYSSSFSYENIVNLVLPELGDPDEFLQKYGVDKLKKLIEGKVREFKNSS